MEEEDVGCFEDVRCFSDVSVISLGWCVVYRIYITLAIFQSYLDLEAKAQRYNEIVYITTKLKSVIK